MAQLKSKTLTKYRSKFEIKIAKQLSKDHAAYESYSIPYTLMCNYWPDFRLSNGIFIEVKGRFKASDRRKHIQVRKEHPELDIRFVFYRANEKIVKKSKTTYADWCNKNGFLWAEKEVPMTWIKEKSGGV